SEVVALCRAVVIITVIGVITAVSIVAVVVVAFGEDLSQSAGGDPHRRRPARRSHCATGARPALRLRVRPGDLHRPATVLADLVGGDHVTVVVARRDRRAGHGTVPGQFQGVVIHGSPGALAAARLRRVGRARDRLSRFLRFRRRILRLRTVGLVAGGGLVVTGSVVAGRVVGVIVSRSGRGRLWFGRLRPRAAGLVRGSCGRYRHRGG